jgi:ankyrin repeat protein
VEYVRQKWQFIQARMDALSSSKGCSKDTMDYAARKGHLDIVQWLHANRSEGCTFRAMDNAASNGHFEIVKWLHANRREGCNTKAMDCAASKGHLDIVQWLHANRSEGCTFRAMDNAASNGHFEIVKWLHANRSEGCTFCKNVSSIQLIDAISNRFLQVSINVLIWISSSIGKSFNILQTGKARL